MMRCRAPTKGVTSMQLPYYMWYEAAHAILGPARAFANATRVFYDNPINPLAKTSYGRTVTAACELFERTTRRYGKPAFDLDDDRSTASGSRSSSGSSGSGPSAT